MPFQIHSLSPIIPASDVSLARDFFVKTLGFEIAMDEDGYVVCFMDDFSVHFEEVEGEVSSLEVYMEVDSVDGFFSDVKSKLVEGTFKEPFDQAYGMREAHIVIPGTQSLLIAGQELEEE
jgi:catechol 2,3-dioxygenase-like lactoylglutathione lyase family enzyme